MRMADGLINMRMYTENEIRLKILNEPNVQLEFLTDSYPRSCYQITLMEDQIRVDFGYFHFEENKDSLYLKLSDYGKTWKFIEYTYVLNQEYELFKIDENNYYISGNVLYSKSIFEDIIPDTPHGKVLRQAEELKDICDAYYIDDCSWPLHKNHFYEKKDYDTFIEDLRENEKHGYFGGLRSGRGIIRTPQGLIFIGRVNKAGKLE